jgi:prephenate dehydratase
MSMEIAHQLGCVRTIHTLGPAGTNCEAAARFWLAARGVSGQVVLHPTLEAGVEAMPRDEDQALLGCAVYPDLHTLVFSNLDRLAIADAFVMPTHEMVLASRDGDWPSVVATHPAPQGLVPDELDRRFVDSNARAAIECAEGRVDGCITTSVAAELWGLRVVRSSGPVPMAFTIHVPRR